jgi:signal transduction histidine kinase
MELIPLELQPLLEDTARQAQYLIKGQIFETDLSPAEGITIQADADYLKQLLLIFLDNAFKYTPAGQKVTFQARVDQDEVQLIFRDEGVGIPPKDLPYLFERFYRAQDSRTGEGTGLGLSIAQWIIEQHQGRVTVSSEWGQGSEFIIYFPVLRLF